MSPLEFESSWIWHPDWQEQPGSKSAGAFVNFTKSFNLTTVPDSPVRIQISADTRYKLYINGSFAHTGPVKGDSQTWFYDEIDIQPYLSTGNNFVAVRVLRFYYASVYATSFPRTPFGGLFIRHASDEVPGDTELAVQTDASWQTSIDKTIKLPNYTKHDYFLHVYEDVDSKLATHNVWVAAAPYKFLASFGLTLPWNLSPRLIPFHQLQAQSTRAIHNIKSDADHRIWKEVLLNNDSSSSVRLLPGTKHHIELQFERHTTAYLTLRFARPLSAGSQLKITYTEGYDEEPLVPRGSRIKGNRCDTSKGLVGPDDRFIFGGPFSSSRSYDIEDGGPNGKELYSPFHFRTFRFIALDIEVVKDSELVFDGIDITETTYPLDVVSRFAVPEAENDLTLANQLWSTSLRTLLNCMHDCYEDCPFYEQMQYAMDTRSSALFTYYVSGDDRLARQAIHQLHNSFQPTLGLTASRAPSHHLQIIPHFSLFWICMVVDHYRYFKDEEFVSLFTPVCFSVLDTYHRRIDPSTGLVRSWSYSKHWDFVDWTGEWKPFGIPSAAKRTGFQTFTNSLLAYTLRNVASTLGKRLPHGLATEFASRADTIVHAILEHCFDGEYFTDGLASQVDIDTDYSEHNQVWAILCGATTPEQGQKLLEGVLRPEPVDESQQHKSRTLTHNSGRKFTRASTAMSFYTLRALSLVGGTAYEDHFHRFWDPWRYQLSQNLTTWVEDQVDQRSDCHAWGSSPLYEFMAEVVGIQPVSAGWNSILFKPRLSLFKRLEARVAIGSGYVEVRWFTAESNRVTKVLLSLSSVARADSVAGISINVVWPDGSQVVLVDITHEELMLEYTSVERNE